MKKVLFTMLMIFSLTSFASNEVKHETSDDSIVKVVEVDTDVLIAEVDVCTLIVSDYTSNYEVSAKELNYKNEGVFVAVKTVSKKAEYLFCSKLRRHYKCNNKLASIKNTKNNIGSSGGVSQIS